jgi:hypothetical protein
MLFYVALNTNSFYLAYEMRVDHLSPAHLSKTSIFGTPSLGVSSQTSSDIPLCLLALPIA